MKETETLMYDSLKEIWQALPTSGTSLAKIVGIACSPQVYATLRTECPNFFVGFQYLPLLIDPRLEPFTSEVFRDHGSWTNRCMEQAEWSAQSKAERHLIGRLAAIEERIAKLERDTHPPVDLRPVIREEITLACRKVGMLDNRET